MSSLFICFSKKYLTGIRGYVSRAFASTFEMKKQANPATKDTLFKSVN